jgi:hypothetical protein
MSWFTKPTVNVETLSPASREDQLAEIEKQYREAERDFVGACFRVAQYNATQKNSRLHILNGVLYAKVTGSRPTRGAWRSNALETTRWKSGTNCSPVERNCSKPWGGSDEPNGRIHRDVLAGRPIAA